MKTLTPFERGLLAHLLADWLLQNEWMACNKHKLGHPAAWAHGLIHALLLGTTLGWRAGLVLGATHVLIDTRHPLRWWQRHFKKTEPGLMLLHVSIWVDQVVHIVCIGLWISLDQRAEPVPGKAPLARAVPPHAPDTSAATPGR